MDFTNKEKVQGKGEEGGKKTVGQVSFSAVSHRSLNRLDSAEWESIFSGELFSSPFFLLCFSFSSFLHPCN